MITDTDRAEDIIMCIEIDHHYYYFVGNHFIMIKYILIYGRQQTMSPLMHPDYKL